jgi:hypothetical protein
MADADTEADSYRENEDEMDNEDIDLSFLGEEPEDKKT